MSAERLLERIADHARAEPEAAAFVFARGDGSERRWTRSEVQALVESWAEGMRASGLRRQDRLVIALPNGPDAIAAFLAALQLGAWPALLPSSQVRGGEEAFVRRTVGLARQARLRLAVASPDEARLLDGALREVRCGILSAPGAVGELPPSPTAAMSAWDAVAYLQLSSGTTARQKAILMTGEALARHLDDYSRFLSVHPGDVVVSWLPLFHDMGLVAGALLPLWNGVPGIVLTPQEWVRRPAMLLEAVHRHRGSLTWMPNFAFAHCARSVRPRELDGLDLSSLRVATNGSEMVRPSTLDAFVERLAPCGLRPEAITPAYGMAENTMAISSTLPGRGPRVDWIRRRPLQLEGRAAPQAPGRERAWGVVSCGPPLPAVEVRIVDDRGRPTSERQIGEVRLRSPYLFLGYLDRPDLTEQAMEDGWLRSGDLGYLAGGEVHLTGRSKDLIIVGGRNIYPEDVEEAACQAASLRSGRVAAFGIEDEIEGTETVILVVEADATGSEAPAIEAAIRRAVRDECEVALREVRFVPSGWIEKTTSAKVARRANRDKYLEEFAASLAAVELRGRHPPGSVGGRV